MSSSTNSNYNEPGTRPIKYKAACNNCHDAKVRCTGEKTGCLRCQNLDHQCIYVESRVGKVPGARGRNKHARSISSRVEQPQDKSSSASATSTTPRVTPPQQQIGSPILWNENDDSYMNWPLDAGPENGSERLDFDNNTSNFFGEADDAMAKGGYDFSAAMPAVPTRLSTELEKDYVNLQSYAGSNSGDIQMTLSDLTAPNQGQSEVRSPQKPESIQIPPWQQKSGGNINLTTYAATLNQNPQCFQDDRQHIFNCLRTVELLERNVLARLSALDEVLALNRRSIEEITKYVQAAPLRQSISCVVVMGILMHLVVSLFESGCEAFHRDFSADGSNHPRLGFGGFQLDAEEQRVWGARVVAKELRRCMKVLQKLNGLMRNPAREATFDACYRDLEPRLKALISLVEA